MKKEAKRNRQAEIKKSRKHQPKRHEDKTSHLEVCQSFFSDVQRSSGASLFLLFVPVSNFFCVLFFLIEWMLSRHFWLLYSRQTEVWRNVRVGLHLEKRREKEVRNEMKGKEREVHEFKEWEGKKERERKPVFRGRPDPFLTENRVHAFLPFCLF